jgi:hypothetical protein
MATEQDERSVTLKGVRLSFTDALPEKKKSSDSEDAKPKHGLNAIIETTGPYAKYAEENKAKCIAGLKAAGQQKWKKPDMYKIIAEDAPKRVCFRKGEKFRNKEGTTYAGYENNFAMSLSGPNGGQRRPRLIDRRKRILIGPGDSIPSQTKQEIVNISADQIADIFYSGCYADIKVSFFGTEKGSNGIFATCELIRSYQEGERMAGGYNYSDDDLDEMDDLEPIGDDDDFSASSKPSGTKSSNPSIDDDDDI